MQKLRLFPVWLVLTAAVCAQNLDPINESILKTVKERMTELVVTTTEGNRREARGVFLSRDGKILVPASVLAGAREVVVRLSDRQEVVASGYLGQDPAADLAVIKIDNRTVFPFRLTTGIDWKFGPAGFLVSGLTVETEKITSVLLQANGPEGAANLGPQSFWMPQDPTTPVFIGSPVVDARGSLLGVVIRLEGGKGMVGVRALSCPLEQFERWSDETVHPFVSIAEPYPVSDPRLVTTTDWTKFLATAPGSEERINAVDRLLRGHEKSALAWWVAAETYQKAKQLEKAQISYAQVTELQPDHWQAWLALGDLQYQLKQYGPALDSFSHAVEASGNGPQTGMACLKMGRCLQQLGQDNQAADQFQKAVSFKKDLFQGWLELARARFRAKDYEAAAQAFLNAAQINPHNLEGWMGLAQSYRELKRPESEVEARGEIARMKPYDADVIYDYAICLNKLGRSDTALGLFERVVDLQPRDAEAWYNVGVLREKLKDSAEAEHSLQKATEYKPSFGQAWRELGLLRAALGRDADAVEPLQTAARLLPKDARIWEQLAIVEKNLGHKEEKEHALEQLESLSPTQAQQLRKDFELFLR